MRKSTARKCEIGNNMKREIRILAINDCAFSFKDKIVNTIAVLFRGGSFLDKFEMFKIKKDGDDATDKIIQLANRNEYKAQLKLIMMKGITLAGFNFIDIKKIYRRTKIPVIVVMRNYPNIKKFLKAAKKFNKNAGKIMKAAGKIEKYSIKGKKLYIQTSGLNKKEIKELLQITVTHANIPEPLRVSNLISKGIKK